jgi:hypothetical protein
VPPVPTVSVDDSAVQKVCGSTLKLPQYGAYYKDYTNYYCTTWILELWRGLKLSVPWLAPSRTGILRGQQAHIFSFFFEQCKLTSVAVVHESCLWNLEGNERTHRATRFRGRRGSGPVQTFGTVTRDDRISAWRSAFRHADDFTRRSRHLMSPARLNQDKPCLNTWTNRRLLNHIFFSLD